jgi:hypothetical protein
MLTKDDVLIVSRHPDLGRLVDEWLAAKNAKIPLDGLDGVKLDGLDQIKFAECRRRDRVHWEDVVDKVVVGCLPLHLAGETKAIIEPVLRVPFDRRGTSLTLDQLKEFCDGIAFYRVHRQRIA